LVPKMGVNFGTQNGGQIWYPKWGSNLVSKMGGQIRYRFAYLRPGLQAFAVWQWWNYYLDQLPPGKIPLRINLDETSVCLFPGDCRGTIFVSNKRPRQEPVQRVARAKRRCCLTHVALICDDSALQPVLPQVIIGNEHTFLKASFADFKAACPANVRLVRQKSAWNDCALCASIVRWLGLALAPHMGRVQPILLLDAVRLHTAKNVLSACSRYRIWPIVVPAKMTWLVQPLDTSAFHLYKASLKRAYQRARGGSPNGDVSLAAFLACLYETIRSVLQGRRWASAFEQDGFGPRQERLSSYIKAQLQIDTPLQLSARRPAVEQLAACFPARAVVPVVALFRPLARAAVPEAVVLPPLAELGPGHVAADAGPGAALVRPGPADTDPEPRTRAQHRKAAAAKAAAASPAGGASSSSAVLGRTRAQSRLLRASASKAPP